MAREEQPREDLIRDAKALTNRAEIELPAGLRVVLGRRSRGGMSFYIGDDPVFHLNSEGELRRAYVDGKLYKAEAGKLIEMERVRTPGQVELRSHALGEAERHTFLEAAARQMAEVVASVDRGLYSLVAEAPTGGGVVDEIVVWLRPYLSRPLIVADAPNVG